VTLRRSCDPSGDERWCRWRDRRSHQRSLDRRPDGRLPGGRRAVQRQEPLDCPIGGPRPAAGRLRMTMVSPPLATPTIAGRSTRRRWRSRSAPPERPCPRLGRIGDFEHRLVLVRIELLALGLDRLDAMHGEQPLHLALRQVDAVDQRLQRPVGGVARFGPAAPAARLSESVAPACRGQIW